MIFFIYTFDKDALKWSKVILQICKACKYKEIIFQINAAVRNFIFLGSKNPENNYIMVSKTILTNTTVFSVYNDNKCFLSTKSAY